MRSNEKHKYHIVLTVPNSKRKIVERGKMDTPNTLLSLPCVGKGCSITGGAGKLVLLAQEEEFEVIKGVIRIRNSKKDIQHYGQNKKDKLIFLADLISISHKRLKKLMVFVEDSNKYNINLLELKYST
jgi:hypothetical protein